jgi:3,4-dihydroxy 2-butanone 4-phosphate synthase / GTP cyclohydrolase II
MATASTVDELVQRTERSCLAKQKRFEFASIEDAVRDLEADRMIVVIDDEDRENEGDLAMAVDMITPEAINFMATHGRGLICLAMTGERLDHLALAPMVPSDSALGGTAVTVSIDVGSDGVTTAISAHDRVRAIKAAIDATSYPDDFARPGHVFPRRRRSILQDSQDYPAGVICEIMNDDGTMAGHPLLQPAPIAVFNLTSSETRPT